MSRVSISVEQAEANALNGIAPRTMLGTKRAEGGEEKTRSYLFGGICANPSEQPVAALFAIAIQPRWLGFRDYIPP